MAWSILSGPYLWGQQDLPKAESLFAKALEASGDPDAVANLQGIRLEGTMAPFGRPATNVEEIHWKGQRGKTELKVEGITFSLRVHPDGVWLEQPGQKNLVPDPDGIPARIASAPILAAEYQSLFDSVTTTEATVFEGEACYEVECRKAGSLLVSVYFSQKSNLVFGYYFKIPSPTSEPPRELTQVFEDYRLVDGIQVAHRITHQESHGDQIMSVKQATINPDFDLSELEPPPDLKTTNK